MNLAKIKTLGLPAKWLEMVNKTFYCCHDQDIINKTCCGRIKPIELKYNVSLSTGLSINSHDVKIMHYAGPANMKPWASKNTPFYEIWNEWETQYKKEVYK